MRPPAYRTYIGTFTGTSAANVKMPHKLVSRGRPGQGVVYKVPMSASSPPADRRVYKVQLPASAPPADRPRGLARRLLPLAAIAILAGAGYFATGDGAV